MNNFRYKLTGIKNIEKIPMTEKINKNDVVVKPTYLSICQADKRYYFGNREIEILNKKIPLCLIHEAIGIVTKSFSPNFKEGDKVILLPNISNSHHESENYDLSSKFMSSSIDGFMQENVIISDQNVIKIKNTFKNYKMLVFSELLSCLIHAVESNRDKINKAESIAIYGDGNLSYLLHLYLINEFKNKKIYVFGVNKNKLDMFSKTVKTINILEKNNEVINYDICFEVVGGNATEKIIDNVINNIKPTGTLILMGVCENKIPINTRMILEKGITIVGRSRSTYNDFIKARNFIYKEYKNIENIISDIIPVKSIEDINTAFEKSLISPFKVIMKWEL